MSKNIKIVTAAMIGHILEFFDFTIYAVFAAELGAIFFPMESEFAQLLSSLAVLAVGFFMRPIGGAVFGHIGDKFGRRTALTISVVGMAFATLLIALLPTYKDVGIIAAVMLVSLRLIQGLCVGGEGAGASIFVLEHLQKVKPGLIGGIVNSALTIGILLAIFTGLILHNTMEGNPDLWRYAFVIGGVMGIAGLYLRLTVEETPVFEAMQQKHQILELPIKTVFTKNFKSVLLTIAVGGLTGCSGYLVMTFVDIFYKSVMALPPKESLVYAVYANILLIVFLPLAGIFSDKIGYAKTISYGSFIAICTSTPIFMLMGSDSQFFAYSGITMLSAVVSIIYAPLYPFMLNLFTPEQRYSGIACSLNIGIALFGGTSSMICLSLVKATGLSYAPAFYWSAMSAMFLIAIMWYKNAKKVRGVEAVSVV